MNTADPLGPTLFSLKGLSRARLEVRPFLHIDNGQDNDDGDNGRDRARWQSVLQDPRGPSLRGSLEIANRSIRSMLSRPIRCCGVFMSRPQYGIQVIPPFLRT